MKHLHSFNEASIDQSISGVRDLENFQLDVEDFERQELAAFSLKFEELCDRLYDFAHDETPGIKHKVYEQIHQQLQSYIDDLQTMIPNLRYYR